MSLTFFSALLLLIFSMLSFLLQNKMLMSHDGLYVSLHEYCLSQYQLLVILPTSGQVLSPLRRPFLFNPASPHLPPGVVLSFLMLDIYLSNCPVPLSGLQKQ